MKATLTTELLERQSSHLRSLCIYRKALWRGCRPQDLRVRWRARQMRSGAGSCSLGLIRSGLRFLVQDNKPFSACHPRLISLVADEITHTLANLRFFTRDTSRPSTSESPREDRRGEGARVAQELAKGSPPPEWFRLTRRASPRGMACRGHRLKCVAVRRCPKRTVWATRAP